MGASKQKWTGEEEAALRAGVEKHGPGKWRLIQKDPELGPILVSRSNVDLKDKWRNMNVSLGGHGSREKSIKIAGLTTGNTTDEPIAAAPLASFPGSHFTDDTPTVADAFVHPESTKEGKSLGPRYEHLVLEALLEMKDPNGSNTGAISNYIENHHPVPSNFRRLLSSKLRSLTVKGKLIKLGQNYKVAGPAHLLSKDETSPQKESEDTKQTRDSDGGKINCKFPGHALKMPTTRHPSKKIRIDGESTWSKVKTAVEAARAAALAVAEAEAAAAAAEEAAKEAEAAEAEAEAAEIVAELVALAVYPPKKSRAVPLATGEVAVTV